MMNPRFFSTIHASIHPCKNNYSLNNFKTYTYFSYTIYRQYSDLATISDLHLQSPPPDVSSPSQLPVYHDQEYQTSSEIG